MRFPRALGALLALVLAGGATGCASTGPRPVSRTIRVVERDFKIDAPQTVRAGDVTVMLHNKGPEAHELLLVRVQPLAALPLRADGMTVDEDALESVTVGALEPGPPGSVRRIHVHLKPGSYELLCNMSGHFMGGMSTRMVAR